MVMSLTMRLRPTPPEDSWGTMSVVAIPAPSFDYGAETSHPLQLESVFPDLFRIVFRVFPRNLQRSGLKKENIRLYGGSGVVSRQIARLEREEPLLKLEGSPSGIQLPESCSRNAAHGIKVPS